MKRSPECGPNTEIPVDREFVETQCPRMRGTDELERLFLSYDPSVPFDPTRFFSTDWYAWQNPDWDREFSSPYLHYLKVGCREGRDPSPFVDMTRYSEMVGDVIPQERMYRAILSGLRSPALGVYESEHDLTECQDAFTRGISPVAHRMSITARPRPSLVVVQAGRGGRHNAWTNDTGREWDLLLNYYDAGGPCSRSAEYVVFQKGTKFTAMSYLVSRFRDVFSRYDHVLFIDDDIETSAADLNRLFAACRSHGLDLAQMSLTAASFCNWPHLFAREGRIGPREISAVEIMMPVFSRRALGWVAPTLGRSASGFGLDLVWGKIVRDRGGRVAVLDDVSAMHARPVDQASGAYYAYLRRHGINAKAELWSLIKSYGAARDLVTT